MVRFCKYLELFYFINFVGVWPWYKRDNILKLVHSMIVMDDEGAEFNLHSGGIEKKTSVCFYKSVYSL